MELNGQEKQIDTKNVDKLAREGLVLDSCASLQQSAQRRRRLTRARACADYVQCVCSPSRVTFLTGRYPLHHGVNDWIPPSSSYGMPANGERCSAAAERLREAAFSLSGANALGRWCGRDDDGGPLPARRVAHACHRQVARGESLPLSLLLRTRRRAAARLTGGGSRFSHRASTRTSSRRHSGDSTRSMASTPAARTTSRTTPAATTSTATRRRAATRPTALRSRGRTRGNTPRSHSPARPSTSSTPTPWPRRLSSSTSRSKPCMRRRRCRSTTCRYTARASMHSSEWKD